MLRPFALLLLAVLLPTLALRAQTTIAPIPAEVSSDELTVTIDGKTSPVLHAAANYYLLNFTISGPVEVAITAKNPHFWDSGVEIQPMRLGIRPTRTGATIRFPLAGLAKLSISRPGDHFGTSEMLFLFANAPDTSGITAATPGIRYFGPGVHRGSINAKSGDTIYLADGAVVFGALNLWQVHNVKVRGTGTLIYDGPQRPDQDVGWMHKRDWHVIVMDRARDIDIQGITCIVRSRTWMIQMRLSRGIRFTNVKVIGGSEANANQDGMDWLGGGDTLVQDSFIRAADDIFAMYGNWFGYSKKVISIPGDLVSNIRIENSVLSTSISNVVRLGWPQKVFGSHNFVLQDSDIIHMGAGGCGVPFALFEVWADKGARGHHANYTFDDLRLDDLYSLTQIIQPNPAVADIHFSNISAMDGPQLVPSTLTGAVSGVDFQNIDLGAGDTHDEAGLGLEITGGAKPPTISAASPAPGFTYTAGLLKPGDDVTLTATPILQARFRWLFGDGASADGPVVHHAFPDAAGTLLDGSGRFRVLLASIDAAGKTSWTSQPVVIAPRLLPALAISPATATTPGLAPNPQHPKSLEGTLTIPADGGYNLMLLTSTSATLRVDGVEVRNAPLQAQVCGSPGDAVQAVRLSAALAAGPHHLVVTRGPEVENATGSALGPNGPVLLWQGPNLAVQPIPAVALSSPAP